MPTLLRLNAISKAFAGRKLEVHHTNAASDIDKFEAQAVRLDTVNRCVALFGGLVLVLVGLGVSVLLLVIQPGLPPVLDILLPGVILPLEAVLGAVIVGAFFSSSCEVTATELIVRFGPIRKRIPLDDLVEVIPRRRLYFPEHGWNLALTHKRI